MYNKYCRNLPLYYELKLIKNVKNYYSIINGIAKSNFNVINRDVSCRMFHNGCWGISYYNGINDETIKNVISNSYKNLKYALRFSKKNSEINTKIFHSKKIDLVGSEKYKQNDIMEIVLHYYNYINKLYSKLDYKEINLMVEIENKDLYSGNNVEYSIICPYVHMQIKLGKMIDGKLIILRDIITLKNNLHSFILNKDIIYNKIDLIYKHLINKIKSFELSNGIKKCIISSKLASKIIHETAGHNSEADFILGKFDNNNLYEHIENPLIDVIDFAYTAFDEICQNPVYFDDEGVISKDVNIYTRGKMTGLLHNRNTSYITKSDLTGNARSVNYTQEPLIRMRNTALLPKHHSLENMFNSVEDGLYLVDGENGFSDITGNFMYEINIGYKIEKGKIKNSIPNCKVSGNTLNFLKSIEMIGSDFEWYSSECTKIHKIRVSHGSPTIKSTLNIGG